jgi:serine/threonine-protein kinase
VPISTSASGPGARERFVPGDIVAGRYRIVGQIGRGGMGEVYRADDLKLGQPVALKFLPEALERDSGRLARFLNEVKVARQVAHPNVCRMYDIGEVDGHHFLSMEYIDGEDLASLIRRIGRVEHEKGVQIARQICAGLGAIHGRNIIHRDLKPANVMIDGRGSARITDFGLAGLEQGFGQRDIQAGTPDYMAPEQLAGKGVSLKSDLYALGQVLYELFSGQPAFKSDTLLGLKKMKQGTTPTSLSSLVSSIDPAVERVIQRCLSADPASRPDSALAVAAALPGGNPLAAALAAGETPSPEMVAAAGPEGGLRPGVALVLFSGFVIGLLGLAALLPRVAIYGWVPLDTPIAVLEDRARDTAVRLGYTDPPQDRFVTFIASQTELRRMAQQIESSMETEYPLNWSSLSAPTQRALYVLYRQSERSLAAANVLGRIGKRDPPPEPGDLLLHLNLDGKLIRFEAIADAVDHSTQPIPSTDWSVLFDSAGLDYSRFEPAEPATQPQLYYDRRAAWSGPWGSAGERTVRVEAASVRGRPVYFSIIRPVDDAWSAETVDEQTAMAGYGPLAGFVSVILVVVIGGAVLLASLNWRRGRGDRRGALRLALYVFSMRLLLWIITGHHVAEPWGELGMLLPALGQSILLATVTWLLYMALEPYVRRLWPESIVSWSRLLSGGYRDPLVGRDLLIGFCFGVLLQYMNVASHHVPELLGAAAQPPVPWGLHGLLGGRWALGGLFSVLLGSLAAPLAYTTLVLILRMIFRVQWLAATAFCLLFTLLSVLEFIAFAGATLSLEIIALSVVLGVTSGVFMIVLLLRFGLLATVGAFIVATTLAYYPITLDPGAPYFATSLLGLLICIALASFAFYGSLAGRPLFEELVPVAR